MKSKILLSIFLLTTVIFLSGSCVNIAGECENSAEKEVVSPNGDFKVIIYNRGCGATVGFLTGITILKSNQKLSDDTEANVVLVEKPAREFWNDNKQTNERGKFNFDAEWVNDNELVIYYTDSRFVTQRGKFENIEIKYKLIK